MSVPSINTNPCDFSGTKPPVQTETQKLQAELTKLDVDNIEGLSLDSSNRIVNSEGKVVASGDYTMGKNTQKANNYPAIRKALKGGTNPSQPAQPKPPTETDRFSGPPPTVVAPPPPATPPAGTPQALPAPFAPPPIPPTTPAPPPPSAAPTAPTLPPLVAPPATVAPPVAPPATVAPPVAPPATVAPPTATTSADGNATNGLKAIVEAGLTSEKTDEGVVVIKASPELMKSLSPLGTVEMFCSPTTPNDLKVQVTDSNGVTATKTFELKRPGAFRLGADNASADYHLTKKLEAGLTSEKMGEITVIKASPQLIKSLGTYSKIEVVRYTSVPFIGDHVKVRVTDSSGNTTTKTFKIETGGKYQLEAAADPKYLELIDRNNPDKSRRIGWG